jgi:hypothetical protein
MTPGTETTGTNRNCNAAEEQKQQQCNAAENEIVNINDVTPNDVVIASQRLRHCYTNEHLSNLKYWAFTANLAPSYRGVNTLKEKYYFADKVLHFVYHKLKGRFLHWKDTRSDKLIVLSPVQARKKVVERFKMSLRKRTKKKTTTALSKSAATTTKRANSTTQLSAVTVEAEAESLKKEQTSEERALLIVESLESEIKKREATSNQGNESYKARGNTFITKFRSKQNRERIQVLPTLTTDEKRERRKKRTEVRKMCRPIIKKVRRDNTSRTFVRFIKKIKFKPKKDRLYFKDVHYRNIESISDFVYNNCEFIIYSKSEWNKKENALKEVCKPIVKAYNSKQNQNYKKKIQWQKYDYNKEYLIGTHGFKLCSGETLVCVKDRLQNYAIKYIYLPIRYNSCHLEEISTSMTELANSVFENKDGISTVRPSAGSTRGMTVINTRGGKKVSSGTLVMSGSHNFIPGASHKVHGITNSTPAVYNFRGKHDDTTLIEKFISVCDSITLFEKKHLPAYAYRRRLLRKNYDPNGRYRISDVTDAFSVSLTSDYAITGHDDNGLTSETIGFVNRNGPLPINHSWNFVAGGCVHTLPDVEGGAAAVFIAADSVFHGTLPTSNTEDTYSHGNLGAALVTKTDMIDSCKRQKQRLQGKEDGTMEFMTARYVFGRNKRK